MNVEDVTKSCAAKCDIKIMASPKRYAYVLNVCNVLGLDIEKDVFFDDREGGGSAAYTSERALNLPFTDDEVTHRCLLQDDVIVCREFRSVLNALVAKKPNSVFSLFCPQSKMKEYAEKYGVPQIVKNRRHGVWGQAIVVPRRVVPDIYSWGNSVARANNARVVYDDVLFGEYAAAHELDVYIPIPNIVQHICPNSSLLGFNNKKKVSKVFDIDAARLPWDRCAESCVSIANSTSFYKVEGLA